MDNFLPIIHHIGRYIHLSEKEQLHFVSLLRLVKVKKKQFIVQPEFTCRYRSYVVKGALRAYLVGNEGQEHTIAFAVEDWWIADYTSYINQTSATLFVEALEETTLIQ